MVWLCMCVRLCVTVPPCPTPQGTPNKWCVESSLPRYSDQFTLRVSYSISDSKECITMATTK